MLFEECLMIDGKYIKAFPNVDVYHPYLNMFLNVNIKRAKNHPTV